MCLGLKTHWKDLEKIFGKIRYLMKILFCVGSPTDLEQILGKIRYLMDICSVWVIRSDIWRISQIYLLSVGHNWQISHEVTCWEQVKLKHFNFICWPQDICPRSYPRSVGLQISARYLIGISFQFGWALRSSSDIWSYQRSALDLFSVSGVINPAHTATLSRAIAAARYRARVR